VLDYLLRHLHNGDGESLKLNVNALDRLDGTPLEDAFRHQRAVAIAMLQDHGGLRAGDKQLVAAKERTRADAELLQKQLRRGKVLELVENSAEARACVWIRGKCGKLLTDKLRELMDLTSTLLQELSTTVEAMDACFDPALPHGGQSAKEACLQSKQYKTFVSLAASVSEQTKQWVSAAVSTTSIMSEELPNVPAALIFSKQYKTEIKSILESFKFTSKALQFLSFLLLKSPQVRQVTLEVGLEQNQRQIKGLGTNPLIKTLVNQLSAP
jgi:hypothetical protein